MICLQKTCINGLKRKKIAYNKEMKRFIAFILIVLVCAFLFLRVIKAKVGHDIAQPIVEPVLTPTPTIVIDHSQRASTALFVPYWAVKYLSSKEYDNYIYFGITATKNGIDATESGTKNVKTFVDTVPKGKSKLLTLRMVKSETNAAILQDRKLQQQIISQTVAFAKANGFSGIVLDLEMSGLPFDSLVDQITVFTKELSKQTKTGQLQFDLTLYGDTFYRLRPFDVKHLAPTADMILLMAYDFHKSRSNPGPNFPLSGQDVYGYDMGKMADDFLQVIPNKKLNVVFGLFGYDWTVDDKGKAISQGEPLTDLQIQSKFLNGCMFQACQVKRDSVSAETVIHYTDKNNQKHIVWFEDIGSVVSKQQALRKKGIVNFSFWANSYF